MTNSFSFGGFSAPGPEPKFSQTKVEGIAKIENEHKVKLLLTGDVMLGRTVMMKSLEAHDPIYPFRKVVDTLRAADLVFVNLENPIIRECPESESGFVFCAMPEMAEGLLFSGVDVANLANNHSRNYGELGLAETISLLGEKGILTTGQGKLGKIERGNVNFGFLGFDFTVNEPSPTDYELIKSSDNRSDVLVVGVHWGVEYTDEPKSYQREWARNMVEAGADVIVGHHPHWVQSFEEISGKPVFYSLGNFIFDQMWSEETRSGLVVELIFEKEELVEINLHETYMTSWAQPEFMD